MTVTGIIAEYNPFHTGHAYHLEQARKSTGADYIIVVMSPDFVQRGEPAVFDKYTRTKMALENGADLVLELPVSYAAGSAEYFARGGVSVLNGLGVVDYLCFGCETPDAASLRDTARILLEEPGEYRPALKEGLKKGLTFPQARQAALQAYLNSLPAHSCRKPHPLAKAPDEVPNGERETELLSSPNNILGLEYCKAILELSSSIRPHPILRTGSAFSSPDLTGAFCSAAAIRRSLTCSCTDELLKKYIPDCVWEDFQAARKALLLPGDLLPLLIQKLIYTEDFEHILDVSPDLADRIRTNRFLCPGKSYEDIVGLLRTKQVTDARIRRALLHIILDITTEDLDSFRQTGTAFYARVLGFRRDAAPLLHAIKKSSGFPLLTKMSRASDQLDETGQKMLRQDFSASHLYRSLQSIKYSLPFRTEYEHSPILIEKNFHALA